MSATRREFLGTAATVAAVMAEPAFEDGPRSDGFAPLPMQGNAGFEDLSLEEVPAILEIIQTIKAARNRTILLVEHKFDMIMAVSDSIAVLKEGSLLCDGPPQAVAQNQEVQEAYLSGGVKHD